VALNTAAFPATTRARKTIGQPCCPFPLRASRKWWPRKICNTDTFYRRIRWWAWWCLLAGRQHWVRALGCGWLQHPQRALLPLAGRTSPQLSKHLRPGSEPTRSRFVGVVFDRASGSITPSDRQPAHLPEGTITMLTRCSCSPLRAPVWPSRSCPSSKPWARARFRPGLWRQLLDQRALAWASNPVGSLTTRLVAAQLGLEFHLSALMASACPLGWVLTSPDAPCCRWGKAPPERTPAVPRPLL